MPENTARMDWVQQVADAYGSGRALALLFDYDGTLTPIVRHPSLARLDGETRELLIQLAALPRVRIGVISGRSLDELRHLVGLRGVYYAGTCGLEIDLLGSEERYPDIESVTTMLDSVHDHLLELLKKFPGTWIERKPGALSIHYRGLLPLAAVCFRIEVKSILTSLQELRMRDVSQAIEVTPVDGWDKGSAVASILVHMDEHSVTNPMPVYFGDSPNDTEGMMLAKHLDGYAVGIGADAPVVAMSRLADPHELFRTLRKLYRRLTENGAVEESYEASNENCLAESSHVNSRMQHGEDSQGILVIDSDDATRARLVSGLGNRGWQVWQARTKQQAHELMLCHGDSIQVALVDLQLPGLQGARLVAELKQQYPGLIRAYLSPGLSNYTAIAFEHLSEIPLFVKPMDVSRLDENLRTLIKKHASKASTELASAR